MDEESSAQEEVVESALPTGSRAYVISWNPLGSDVSVSLPITVNGRSAELYTSKDAVLFKFAGGEMQGVMVDYLQGVSFDDDSLLVAYIDSGSVKSVKVSPVEEAAVFFMVGNQSKSQLERLGGLLFQRAKGYLETKLRAMSKDRKWVWSHDEYLVLKFWENALESIQNVASDAFEMTGSRRSQWPEGARLRMKYLNLVERVIVNITKFMPSYGNGSAVDLRTIDPSAAAAVFFVNTWPEDSEAAFMAKGVIDQPMIKKALGNRLYDVVCSFDVDGGQSPGEYLIKKNEKGETLVSLLASPDVTVSSDERDGVLTAFEEASKRELVN